jgi:spermidine/putrescine transport system substrate-binding protein
MRPLTDDPIVRQLVTNSRASVLSRRTVLSGAAAAGAALALAACSTGTDVVKGGIAKDESASVKQFAWQNWPRFIDGTTSADAPTLVDFTSKTGIHINYLPNIEGNDFYYASVKTQLSQASGIGADAVTLTDWMVDRWIGLGYAQRLDHSAIPNLKNLDPKLKSPDFDPGRSHSLPWNSGFTGLAWNADKVPRGLGDIIDLWRPELKGKVGVLSEMRDTIGLIMMSLGTDISGKAWGDAEFGQAIAELEKYVHNGQIRNIKGSDYLDDLRSGAVVATMAWSGDIARLNAEAGGSKFIFGLPGSGGALWTTDTMIPIGSREKANVEKLLDYYYEPEVAATVAAYTHFIPPVAGAQSAMEKIDPELAGSQSIFPSTDTLGSLQRFRTLSAAEQTRYAVNFQGVLLGG